MTPDERLNLLQLLNHGDQSTMNQGLELVRALEEPDRNGLLEECSILTHGGFEFGPFTGNHRELVVSEMFIESGACADLEAMNLCDSQYPARLPKGIETLKSLRRLECTWPKNDDLAPLAALWQQQGVGLDQVSCELKLRSDAYEIVKIFSVTGLVEGRGAELYEVNWERRARWELKLVPSTDLLAVLPEIHNQDSLSLECFFVPPRVPPVDLMLNMGGAWVSIGVMEKWVTDSEMSSHEYGANEGDDSPAIWEKLQAQLKAKGIEPWDGLFENEWHDHSTLVRMTYEHENVLILSMNLSW